MTDVALYVETVHQRESSSLFQDFLEFIGIAYQTSDFR